jgi:hypothetical protein
MDGLRRCHPASLKSVHVWYDAVAKRVPVGMRECIVIRNFPVNRDNFGAVIYGVNLRLSDSPRFLSNRIGIQWANGGECTIWKQDSHWGTVRYVETGHMPSWNYRVSAVNMDVVSRTFASVIDDYFQENTFAGGGFRWDDLNLLDIYPRPLIYLHTPTGLDDSAIQKDETEKGDPTSSNRDVVQSFGDFNLRFTIFCFVLVSAFIAGIFFHLYGERGWDFKHIFSWWLGYILLVLSGGMIAALLISSSTQALFLT